MPAIIRKDVVYPGGSVEIVDNLDSTASDKALSANMGREIKEELKNRVVVKRSNITGVSINQGQGVLQFNVASIDALSPPSPEYEHIQAINISAYAHPGAVLIGNVSANNIFNDGYLYAPVIANSAIDNESIRIDVFWSINE